MSRYHERQATPDETTAALREFPSHDLVNPAGVLLLARVDGVPCGCVGLRVVPDRTGEVTRLFVVDTARGRGLGSPDAGDRDGRARPRLIRLRLDTRTDLVEARRLYARLAYREVAPFNASPYAGHWFEKRLE